MHVALASLACALLAARGLRSKSLSPDGAAAAVAVGMATFTAPVPCFTTVLLAFYLSSSKLTKYKAAVKKKLEEEYREGGQRNHVQVLSNGALGALLALIYTAFVGGGRPTCPPPSIPDAWWGLTEACILLMYLGHYACCCGDTWASELGVLQKTWPVLITTLKPVPPGTNGGVSPLGLLASTLGGLFIGVVMAISFHECPTYPSWVVFPVIGAATGLFGSLHSRWYRLSAARFRSGRYPSNLCVRPRHEDDCQSNVSRTAREGCKRARPVGQQPGQHDLIVDHQLLDGAYRHLLPQTVAAMLDTRQSHKEAVFPRLPIS